MRTLININSRIN